MKTKHGAKAALAIAAAAALVVGLTQPASAATRSTVVVIDSNTFTSLNSGTSDGNTTYNSQLGYLTGSGFLYYDNQTVLKYIIGSASVGTGQCFAVFKHDIIS